MKYFYYKFICLQFEIPGIIFQIFFLCESSSMSLPLYNTVEVFFFFPSRPIWKFALFNTVGTCSGVVYLLNCYGTLMVQPSNQVSWEPRKEELFVFLSLVDEAPLHASTGPGVTDVGLPTRSLWSERKEMYTSIRWEIWARHCADHLISFPSSSPSNPKGQLLLPSFCKGENCGWERPKTLVSHQVSVRVGPWAQMCALSQSKAKQD